MYGYQAKQSYGLTTTWTAKITGDDTSFTFSPYAGKTDNTSVNFFNGSQVIESESEADTTSASLSTSQSIVESTSTVESQSVSTSKVESPSVSASESEVVSSSLYQSD